MTRLPRALALVLALTPTSAAGAQVATMPAHVQEHLARMGEARARGARPPETSLDVYTPILGAAPRSAGPVTRDVAYGPDARHRLDVYQPAPAAGRVPIVVFVHGGGYVGGDKDVNEEVYGNIPTYFARQGMLGVNATYRLAPTGEWPAGAEDVGRVVAWLRENAARFGGDPDRIYLIGHSAGATHVATYAYNRSLHPPDGPRVAGLVLMSGRYRVSPRPDDPNFNSVQAYFGPDAARYPERSAISHVADAPRIPAFLVVAEYDQQDLDTQGALLFATLCERDRACPRFRRMELHNHLSMVYQFNTADEALGREIVNFIRRGR